MVYDPEWFSCGFRGQFCLSILWTTLLFWVYHQLSFWSQYVHLKLYCICLVNAVIISRIHCFEGSFFKVKLYPWRRLTAVETTIMRVLTPTVSEHVSLKFTFLIYLWKCLPLMLFPLLSAALPFLIKTTLACVLCINVKNSSWCNKEW